LKKVKSKKFKFITAAGDLKFFNHKTVLFTGYFLLITFFSIPGPVGAQVFGMGEATSGPGPFAGFRSGGKDPVEITADRMEADLGSGSLRFIGRVRAKQGKRTIYAERMDVSYTEGGEVTKLVASGSVKVNMDEAFASSDRLELDNVKQVIRLTGSPRVAQGRQIMTGDLITYQIKTEKLTVKNPRIEWLPERAPQSGKAIPPKTTPGSSHEPAPPAAGAPQ